MMKTILINLTVSVRRKTNKDLYRTLGQISEWPLRPDLDKYR